MKVYYVIRFCSSTGYLHPSNIRSSTPITQTIRRHYSKLFVQSFAFWKYLPSTHHTIISRLCRFHLSYRRKNEKKGCLKYSNYRFFQRIFLLLFFSDSWAENRHRRISAVSHIKLKFTKHAQQNTPLLVNLDFLGVCFRLNSKKKKKKRDRRRAKNDL